MDSVIENLWNGNISPGENCGVGDPEIENLVILTERNRESLTELLAGTQKELFEKYIGCIEEYTYLISMRAFRDGFCLAARLMAEALSSETP